MQKAESSPPWNKYSVHTVLYAAKWGFTLLFRSDLESGRDGSIKRSRPGRRLAYVYESRNLTNKKPESKISIARIGTAFLAFFAPIFRKMREKCSFYLTKSKERSAGHEDCWF